MKKSSLLHFTFESANESWRKDNQRLGETKLSQKIKFGISETKTRYALLGISEDIGPQMNGGLPGSKNGFHAVCSAFQNVQSNRFLDGAEICILGEITQNEEFVSISKCTNWVEELDEFVFEILSTYHELFDQLIVVGGGHNNAYPLLKFSKWKSKNRLVSINLDPHADCRTVDFRHSGNPFSFAIDDKIVDQYCVFGLHESYNNEFILDFLESNSAKYNFFEDFLDDEKLFWKNLKQFAKNENLESAFVLDIDMDCIAFQPASAYSPSGFSIENVRKAIRILAQNLPILVLHLPEGAPKTTLEENEYGKMIAYFISDFIKKQNQSS